MPNPSDHPALDAYNSDEPVCEGGHVRLIDADKLRERQFAVGDGDTHAVEAVVSLDDIDAQPVIACETCGTVGGWNREASAEKCAGCRCGDLYEPKEQT
jgi:hypothetical protein